MLEHVAGLRQVLKQVAAGLKIRAVTTISKLLAFFGVFCFLAFVFVFNSYADSFEVYGPVTSDSSQANILIDTLFNQDDFNYFGEFVIWRNTENEYILAYRTDSNQTVWSSLRYFRTTNNYNSQWIIDSGVPISDLHLITHSYPIVSNIKGFGGNYSLLPIRYKEHVFYTILTIFSFVFMIVFLFKSFRFNKSPYRG